MSLHNNNMSAAEALEHLARIVERDELTPAEAAACVRANWQWEREYNNCEMPGAVLVEMKELEGRELKPSDLAAVLRSWADQARRELGH